MVPPRLTVAVTGPTGTFGFGLVPLLQADERIERIIGIARRPFDPAEFGWSKMSYCQGDVREPQALEAAFRGTDVVVHLAFMITGTASRENIRAINVEGTLNALEAAAKAGAKRFVYSSSVAAYGFHRDNPIGMTEDWPARRANHLFYAQEKADIERLLSERSAAHADLALYMLRPPIVLGPHAVGAKALLPGPLSAWAGRVATAVSRFPLKPPLVLPGVPIQFIHEDDVGRAFLRCVVGAGPPGAYNIAADEVMTADEVSRELGFPTLRVPEAPVHNAARALASLPRPSFLPPTTEWVEAISHPAIMDTSKARKQLGWKPRYTARQALRGTLAAS